MQESLKKGSFALMDLELVTELQVQLIMEELLTKLLDSIPENFLGFASKRDFTFILQ